MGIPGISVLRKHWDIQAPLSALSVFIFTEACSDDLRSRLVWWGGSKIWFMVPHGQGEARDVLLSNEHKERWEEFGHGMAWDSREGLAALDGVDLELGQPLHSLSFPLRAQEGSTWLSFLQGLSDGAGKGSRREMGASKPSGSNINYGGYFLFQGVNEDQLWRLPLITASRWPPFLALPDFILKVYSSDYCFLRTRL